MLASTLTFTCSVTEEEELREERWFCEVAVVCTTRDLDGAGACGGYSLKLDLCADERDGQLQGLMVRYS